MQSLLSTMRAPLFAFGRRKKPKFMEKRKLLKRVKKLNIYNRNISDEQQFNNWLTPKRIKAMGNHIQWMRNNHIGSSPVSQSTQKELLTEMPELSDYQYYLYRNRHTQYMEFKQVQQQSNINEVIGQLPLKLRSEMEELVQKKPMHIPDSVFGIKRYIDQVHVCLPEDQRLRYQLLMMLAPKPTQTQMEGGYALGDAS